MNRRHRHHDLTQGDILSRSVPGGPFERQGPPVRAANTDGPARRQREVAGIEVKIVRNDVGDLDVAGVAPGVGGLDRKCHRITGQQRARRIAGDVNGQIDAAGHCEDLVIGIVGGDRVGGVRASHACRCRDGRSVGHDDLTGESQRPAVLVGKVFDLARKGPAAQRATRRNGEIVHAGRNREINDENVGVAWSVVGDDNVKIEEFTPGGRGRYDQINLDIRPRNRRGVVGLGVVAEIRVDRRGVVHRGGHVEDVLFRGLRQHNKACGFAIAKGPDFADDRRRSRRRRGRRGRTGRSIWARLDPNEENGTQDAGGGRRRVGQVDCYGGRWRQVGAVVGHDNIVLDDRVGGLQVEIAVRNTNQPVDGIGLGQRLRRQHEHREKEGKNQRQQPRHPAFQRCPNRQAQGPATHQHYPRLKPHFGDH